MEELVPNKQKFKNQRGIAPIIAIIALIPVAVSGGAATMVFAQELIKETQVSDDIQIESVKIIGYDVRDVEELKSHNGLYMKLDTAGIADGLKSESERIAIYVQNDSPAKIGIDELRFAGSEYQFSGAFNVLDTFESNISPPKGEYVILSKNPDILVEEGRAELQPGKLASVVVGLDDDFKLGRASQLKLTTTNGFVIVADLNMGDAKYKNSDFSVVTYTDPDPDGDDPPPEEEPPGPECTTTSINFDADDAGAPLLRGTIMNTQLHGIDIHISAENNRPGHPDEAIIFDSNDPSGGDSDLGGPWDAGNIDPGTNLGNILIIAEDIVDSNGDGYVDDPDDEAQGGVIYVQSYKLHCYLSFDLIDIEPSEGHSGYVVVHLDEGGSRTFHFNDFTGVTYGDNSANKIVVIAEEIGGMFYQVDFHLDGSGAIDSIIFG